MTHRLLTLAFTAVLILIMAPGLEAQQPPARPNVVVIMVDDLGFSDIGCYGSEIQTPNLDRLAAGGLRFNQFYNTAKCHSSRVSLLTGLYCDQAGGASLKHGATFAQVLGDAGYFTAMVGKWHLKDQPTDHGFDRYFGHLSGATNFFRGDNTFRLNGQKWDDFGEDFYTTINFTDYAIDFVDQAAASGKPMLLYIAHNAPHYPLQCLEEDYRKYEDTYTDGWDAVRARRIAKQRELGLFGEAGVEPAPRPDDVPAWDTLSAEQKDWEAQRMAAFAAMVDRVDQETGRLVAHLKEKGMLDNTLILFVSDNGACPFDRTRGGGPALRPWDPKSYWCYSTGWAHVGNTPFRLYKQNQHEGGISSPAIVHWPAGLKAQPGSITDQSAHLIDVMATLIELGGATYPEQDHQGPIDPLVGKSLVPILEGKVREPHESLYFHFAQNRALIVGHAKIVSFRGGPWELYGLAKDRTELHDLAARHPELVKAMAAEWHRIATEVDRLPPGQTRPVSDTAQKPNY